MLGIIERCFRGLLSCLVTIPAKLYRHYNPDFLLIGSRSDEADGNALDFYNWVKDKNKCVFVLNKAASQYQKDMIPWNSFRHVFYSAAASVHVFDGSESCGCYSDRLRNAIGLNTKHVFLSHGVTRCNIPKYNYTNSKFDLITVVSQQEFEYVNKVWGYPEKNIALTGFARYDDLFEKCTDKRFVLIMPTWRHEFKKITDEEFVKSRFFIEYQSLLNNKGFIEFLKANNIGLRFYLHYMIKDRMHLFNIPSDIEIYDESDSVHELLRDCSMLITDYSSVSFDAAFAGKPIIYYQFQDDHYDQEDSYFKYDRDGFGPVVKSEGDLVQEIFKFWNGDCFEQKQLYTDRRNSFFEYNDANNCQRIYDCIVNMIDDER